MSNFYGFRDTCYFCSSPWGSCHCFPEVADVDMLFLWYGTCICSPNLDDTGRFFVDPSVYYGRPYLDWIINQLRLGLSAVVTGL